MRNAGIIGKNSAATGEPLKGLGDLGDKFLNRIGTSAGLGYLYALSYVSQTGGTLTTYSGGADITSTLDGYAGNTNGDALFLPAGTYLVDTETGGANFTGTYGAQMFPSGFYGVFGGDPQKTCIRGTVDATATRAENTLVCWDDAGIIKFTAGYLTLVPNTFSGTNYQCCLFHGTGTTDLEYALFKNCAINKDGDSYSTIYDNNSDNGFIWLKNCSVGNRDTYLPNYNGNMTNKECYNCLLEDNWSTGSDWGTLTDTDEGVGSVFTVTDYFMTYNTATYSTSGHLYGLDDTTWSEPA